MLYSIQALRAIAASAVALRHSVYFVDISSTDAFPVSNYISGLGSAGVHIFFVVSGFIMMWTNQDSSSNWRSFLRKRFSRIYPSYWLIAALSIPAALYLGAQLPDTAEKWFGAFFLLPEGASSLIFVGWTLAYEVYFYLLFALALALGLPAFYRVLWLTVFFVASIFVGVFLIPPSMGFMGIPKLVTSVLLLEFAAGAWIGWMATRGLKATVSSASAMILIAAAGFGLSLWLGYKQYPSVILWGIPSILLVIGCISLEARGVGQRFFRWLSPLGDSSYALYLIHAILIPLLMAFIPQLDDLSLFAFLTLSFAIFLINILISHLYFLYVERRLVRLSNQLLAEKTSARHRSQ
ncbi:acyltransferase family protein [Ruegeria atlantica]|uniref:acyltransferase family protein n=1 Tax=Ruegeria atlantica TaxID=81569 RepID=UPI00148130C2|nr:acyltransferase [Ruegeria atlantica]